MSWDSDEHTAKEPTHIGAVNQTRTEASPHSKRSLRLIRLLDDIEWVGIQLGFSRPSHLHLQLAFDVLNWMSKAGTDGQRKKQATHFDQPAPSPAIVCPFKLNLLASSDPGTG